MKSYHADKPNFLEFLDKWLKWPWRSRSMTSIFNTSREYPKMHVWCKFGDSSPNIWRVLCGQAEFPGILSQNGQNDLEGQSQWPPFSMPAESIPGCMFGANLMILAQIYDELLCGQAEFPRILSQNGQNDLEGQGQWPPFSIPAKSIPRCMFGANLVIPAQICDELSCGKGKVYGQTDGQTQATAIPLLQAEGVKSMETSMSASCTIVCPMSAVT